MGLGGNIGGLEWGLFAPEITHYLQLRWSPSPGIPCPICPNKTDETLTTMKDALILATGHHIN